MDLETAFNLGVSEYPLRLAGADYIVNFQIMMQMRKGDRTRRREVRRDAPTLPAKGNLKLCGRYLYYFHFLEA